MDNNEREKSRDELLAVTGLSDAGESLVIQCLKDMGYSYIDNLPPVLLPKFVELIEQGNPSLRKVAIAIDLRGEELFNPLVTVVDKVKSESDVIIDVMFLEASTEKSTSRYKEAHRTRPLMEQGKESLINAINDRREHLSQIRNIANFAIDTTRLSPRELKERIRRYYEDEEFETLTISVAGFGFKHGIQVGANLVFDVRSLPNPYYVVDLRPLAGSNKDVYNYVVKRKETETFFEKLTDLLDFMTPGYKKERKSQLIVAIDRTGEQHRSIALTERLDNYLNEVFEYNVYVHHRDAHIESSEKE